MASSTQPTRMRDTSSNELDVSTFLEMVEADGSHSEYSNVTELHNSNDEQHRRQRTRVLANAPKTKEVRHLGACFYHHFRKTSCQPGCIQRHRDVEMIFQELSATKPRSVLDSSFQKWTTKEERKAAKLHTASRKISRHDTLGSRSSDTKSLERNIPELRISSYTDNQQSLEMMALGGRTNRSSRDAEIYLTRIEDAINHGTNPAKSVMVSERLSSVSDRARVSRHIPGRPDTMIGSRQHRQLRAAERQASTNSVVANFNIGNVSCRDDIPPSNQFETAAQHELSGMAVADITWSAGNNTTTVVNPRRLRGHDTHSAQRSRSPISKTGPQRQLPKQHRDLLVGADLGEQVFLDQVCDSAGPTTTVREPCATAMPSLWIHENLPWEPDHQATNYNWKIASPLPQSSTHHSHTTRSVQRSLGMSPNAAQSGPYGPTIYDLGEQSDTAQPAQSLQLPLIILQTIDVSNMSYDEPRVLYESTQSDVASFSGHPGHANQFNKFLWSSCQLVDHQSCGNFQYEGQSSMPFAEDVSTQSSYNASCDDSHVSYTDLGSFDSDSFSA